MIPPRSFAVSRGGVAALQVWGFLFVAVAGTAILAAYPPVRTFAVLVYAVPVVVWAIVRVRGPWRALDAAILAALLLHLVVSLASADPPASLESLGTVVAFAATFWLARSWARNARIQAGVAAAVLAALAFWVAAISVTWVMEKVADVQLFGWPPRLEAHQPYVWGSINTPPVLLLLAVPFVGFMPPGRFRAVTAAILVLGAVVIVPFSVGRAAWLGIVVALFVTEWVLGFPTTRRLVGPGRRTAAMGVGAVAVAAIAFAVATRVDAIALALDSRIRLWDQALRLFAADPLTGSGPMTFAWARLQHVPDYVDRVAAGAAHNVAMQTLADGGLVLTLALALIVGAWVREVVLAHVRTTSAQRLAIAALAGYATVTLLDDLSFLPAITVLLIVLAAWAVPLAVPIPRHRRAGGLVLPAVLGLAALVSLPSVVAMNLMRLEAAAGREVALAGDWGAARDRFRRTTELQPANALHWLSLGLAEYRLGNTDEAREAYENARLASPGDPRPWGALAAISSGSDAEHLLAEAARRSNDPQYAWRLGLGRHDAGESVAAVEALAVAAIYEPMLVPAAVAVEPALDRDAVEKAGAIVGTLAEVSPEVAVWDVELLRDRVDADAPLPWQVARRVDAGDISGATVAVEDALAAAPHDVRGHGAAAAVARLSCNEDAYVLAQRRAQALGGGERSLGQRLGERRIGIYGLPDLGDYQPIDHDILPVTRMWPTGLIEVRDCGW